MRQAGLISSLMFNRPVLLVCLAVQSAPPLFLIDREGVVASPMSSNLLLPQLLVVNRSNWLILFQFLLGLPLPLSPLPVTTHVL